jgi:AcrR family transcriptional regulator
VESSHRESPAPTPGRSGLDRRRQRREATIEEILDVALTVMAEDGVAALSLSEVARRMGLRQPSLYKYFPSKLAVFDALFARAAAEHLAAVMAAAKRSDPGLPAIRACTEAMLRWSLANRVSAELLFWRPVPGFTPSPAAMAPAVAMVQEIRSLLAVAAERGHLHTDADSEDGVALLSVLVAGAATQQVANEPDASFEKGRYTPLCGRLLDNLANTNQPRK